MILYILHGQPTENFVFEKRDFIELRHRRLRDSNNQSTRTAKYYLYVILSTALIEAKYIFQKLDMTRGLNGPIPYKWLSMQMFICPFYGDLDMSTVLVLAALLGPLATAIWFFFARPGSRSSLPPGPPKLPIIGNIFNMPKDKPWIQYKNWSREYGA